MQYVFDHLETTDKNNKNGSRWMWMFNLINWNIFAVNTKSIHKLFNKANIYKALKSTESKLSE